MTIHHPPHRALQPPEQRRLALLYLATRTALAPAMQLALARDLAPEAPAGMRPLIWQDLVSALAVTPADLAGLLRLVRDADEQLDKLIPPAPRRPDIAVMVDSAALSPWFLPFQRGGS
ncbi:MULTISPECIES: hypothetical protein [Protofrankia]|nr:MULTISPECIES: hypothetical protein [Protofrankia]